MSTAVATRETAAVAERDPQLDAIKRVLSQRTPNGEVRERIGRGGVKLKYTDGAYVIRTLNDAFGWDWDFVADSEELLMNGDVPFEVKVRGMLTVRMSGRTVIKTQYGSQPIEMLKNGSAPVSIGDCYKGAATDAMKKCASLLGIALDLYDSDYRADKYADDSEPEPQPVRKPDTRDVPKDKPKIVWPNMVGVAGQVFGKCSALRFTPVDLANYIQLKFNLAVSDDPVAALEALSALQRHELDQALAAEFNNRSRTR